jgi:hypothetical protein
MAIRKIVSGGQTGADRAAVARGIEHGGWCPRGRRAEDGIIPERYSLQQTPGRGYRQRTKWNVRDSDATLIITSTAELNGGSLFTQEYARKLNRPHLHVYPGNDWRERITFFLNTNLIRTLNVAGSRSSSAKNIEAFVREVLDEVLRSAEPC